MPCPFATELARSTEKLHAVQMERAAAAKKSGDRAKLARLDRTLIQLNRAHNAAKRSYEDAQRRNKPNRLEAAE